MSQKRDSSFWPTLQKESSNHSNKLGSTNTDSTVAAVLVFVTVMKEILLESKSVSLLLNLSVCCCFKMNYLLVMF